MSTSHASRHGALMIAAGCALGGTRLPEQQNVSCTAGAPVAFVDAMVLTMDSPDLVRRATIVVQNGKIAAIDARAIPPGSCRVPAAGKVLMPGLSDMHVHTSEPEMPLFLANGVTLVREMNGSPTHLTLRERLAHGKVAGPRMLVASTLLVGEPLRYRHALIRSADAARRTAREAKQAGYDYLKVYDALSREAYEALVAEGAALGIPLDGHIPADVGIATVLEAGQSLQHMDKIAFAIGGHSGDTSKLAQAREIFRDRRPWVTPTLASLLALDLSRTSEYAAWLQRPEMAWADAATFSWWASLSGERPARERSSYYQFQKSLLPILRESGARFLLGTDAANPLMVAGFSVHDELATLVRDGGFTPYEALLSATRTVGEFLGDSLRGRVAVGAPADLILVNANPLEDLNTLRKPAGVMVNGRWFDRSALDAMLTGVRRR